MYGFDLKRITRCDQWTRLNLCLFCLENCTTTFKGNISSGGIETFNFRVCKSSTDLSNFAVGTIFIKESLPNLSYSSSIGNKDSYFENEPSILQSNVYPRACSAPSLPSG